MAASSSDERAMTGPSAVPHLARRGSHFSDSSPSISVPPKPILQSPHIEEEEQDIYRGQSAPPSPTAVPVPLTRVPSQMAHSISSGSSSSSGWHERAGGALAALVERAITRWARSSSSSTTSSSSSSSSSSDSIKTRAKTPFRRRRRMSTSSHNAASATNVTTQAARKAALETALLVPREFVLFLPSSLSPTLPSMSGGPEVRQRVVRTASQQLILSRLDSALKKAGKSRRDNYNQTKPSTPESSQPQVRNPVIPELSLSAPTPSPSNTDLKKLGGKGRPRHGRVLTMDDVGDGQSGSSVPRQWATPSPGVKQSSWWLDVASPTWDDMRSLGRLLRLHPLTLEDILQQEPREKLELFPRLGYYFVVFRTIADAKPIATRHDVTEGTALVYLVVFREGICSFHFQDISQHTERVRSKVLQLEETVSMSSDWIAHGLLDSMVDSFVPVIDHVEREVVAVDSLVAGMDEDEPEVPKCPTSVRPPLVVDQEKSEVNEKATRDKLDTSGSDSSNSANSAGLVLQAPPRSWVSIYLESFVGGCRSGIAKLAGLGSGWRGKGVPPPVPAPSPRLKTLLRMTATRRTVTSLGRLLAPKNDVIGQIRKRLTGSGNSGTSDIEIYFGDIHDHILTMQQSLDHYERILSHAHPAYISFLRVSLSQAKGGSDKIIFTLTVITTTVLSLQVITGAFSLNIKLPHNTRVTPPPDPPAPFNMFGVVLGLIVLVGIIMTFFVRWLWLSAKKKHRRGRSKTM